MALARGLLFKHQGTFDSICKSDYYTTGYIFQSGKENEYIINHCGSKKYLYVVWCNFNWGHVPFAGIFPCFPVTVLAHFYQLRSDKVATKVHN